MDDEYSPPEFATSPSSGLAYQVLKEGNIIESGELNPKEGHTFITIGRLPTCGISLENPSVSRIHAIIQFARNSVVMLYDRSTHGTFLNKKRIPPRKFVPLMPGQENLIRFGESTRVYLIRVPNINLAELKGRHESEYAKDSLAFLNSWLQSRHSSEPIVEKSGQKIIMRIPQDVLGLSHDLTSESSGKESLKIAALGICRNLDHFGFFDSLPIKEDSNSSNQGDELVCKEEDSLSDLLEVPQNANYEQLLEKRDEISRKLDSMSHFASDFKDIESADSLDVYMNEIELKIRSEKEENQSQVRVRLKSSLERINELLKITEPHELIRKRDLPNDSTEDQRKALKVTVEKLCEDNCEIGNDLKEFYGY